MRNLALMLLGLTLLAGDAHAGLFSRAVKKTPTATTPTGTKPAPASKAAKPGARAKATAAKEEKERLLLHEATVTELHASFENLHQLKRTRWWKALKAAEPVYQAAMAKAEAASMALETAKSPTHAAQLRDQALVAYQVAKQTSQLRQGLWYSKPALLSGAELARVAQIAARLELEPKQLDEAYAEAMSAQQAEPHHAPDVNYEFGVGVPKNQLLNYSATMFTQAAVRTPFQHSFVPVAPLATMETLP